jgi:hypothetical protein
MMLIAALGVSTLIANIEEFAPASTTHIMGDSVGGNLAPQAAEAQVAAMNASNLQTLTEPASRTGTARRQTQSASTCKAGTRISTDLSPVGVARRDVIPDSAFTASSFYTYQGQDYSPAHARLNNSLWWASAKEIGETTDAAESQDEWLRIDLGEEISIRAIETQGSVADNEVGFDFWTTQFKISWSGDSTCEDNAGSVCAAAPAWETFGHGGNPYYSCESLPVMSVHHLRVCERCFHRLSSRRLTHAKRPAPAQACTTTHTR